MGKELDKQYVSGVYESTRVPNHNTLLQGLFGRCCGYHSFLPKIYLPYQQLNGEDDPTKGQCNAIHEYLAIVDSEFQIAMSKTQHVRKRSRKSLREESPYKKLPYLEAKCQDVWTSSYFKESTPPQEISTTTTELNQSPSQESSQYSEEQGGNSHDEQGGISVSDDESTQTSQSPTDTFHTSYEDTKEIVKEVRKRPRRSNTVTNTTKFWQFIGNSIHNAKESGKTEGTVDSNYHRHSARWKYISLWKERFGKTRKVLKMFKKLGKKLGVQFKFTLAPATTNPHLQQYHRFQAIDWRCRPSITPSLDN